MKEPIEVKDARKGDVIRHEWDVNEHNSLIAREEVYNGNAGNWYSGAKRHYLIERPETYVSVPLSALDELRNYWRAIDFPNTPATRRIDKFLAAVDASKP